MTKTGRMAQGKQGKLLTEVVDGAGEASEGLTRTVGVEHHVEAGDERSIRTRKSVLWAAYGDALGYISELADGKFLKRRTRGAALDHLMAWERRIGGRSGVEVRLPAGCWSDDTQLRMAVSRAINRHGFDVEVFARIELPVWPSYALGGGRASKAAAKNLAKPKTMWCANTFPKWVDAGGNGAAMRIQPHVWSSPNLGDGGYLRDVISDSVCTHGHLRAVVGACFHAATLAHCLSHGEAPTLDMCAEIATGLEDKVQLIEDHPKLGSIWIPLWEKESRKRLREEWQATLVELRTALEQVAEVTAQVEDTTQRYQEICNRLGLHAKHQRGSGVLTTVAAVAIAGISSSAHEAVVLAANALGTDTDTIATMAGALLGACDDACEPPEAPLDLAYLLSEADRLVSLSQDREVDSHLYPDLLTWVAPRTQADALVRGDHNQFVVEGLGPVTELGEPIRWTPRRDFGWQWVRTEFGETLLIKRRPSVSSLSEGNSRVAPFGPAIKAQSDPGTKPMDQEWDTRGDTRLSGGLNIDAAVRYAKKNIADDTHLGYTLREVAQRGTIADLVALTSLLRNPLRSTPPSRPPGRDSRSPLR